MIVVVLRLRLNLFTSFSLKIYLKDITGILQEG